MLGAVGIVGARAAGGGSGVVFPGVTLSFRDRGVRSTPRSAKSEVISRLGFDVPAWTPQARYGGHLDPKLRSGIHCGIMR